MDGVIPDKMRFFFFRKRILNWIYHYWSNNGIFSFAFMSCSKGFLALKMNKIFSQVL